MAEKSETPPVPGTPGAPDTPGASDAPDAPGAPGAPDAPGAPGAQDAPGASGAPADVEAPGAAIEAELAAAKADVDRIRADNARLADDFRLDPSEGGREGLKRAAASLHAARDRVQALETSLAIFKRSGSPYGLLAQAGRVVGSIAVLIKPGMSREERTRLIDEALVDELTNAARQLCAVLAAAPERFTRERPGRDAEGRTVLDVAGNVEGDKLMPAVSSAAKRGR